MNINKYKKIFILIFLFGFLTISRSFAVDYPNISPNINNDQEAVKKLISLLKNHNCLSQEYNTNTIIYTTTGQNAVKKFQSINSLTSNALVDENVWNYLSTASGTKAKDGKIVKDCDPSSTNSGNPEDGEGDINSEVTPYKNVGSFSGEAVTTNINNNDSGGLGDAINYLITIMGVAIVILIIYRVLQGAIIKGTFDNIYDQQNAKKSFRTAGIGLIIFIFAYAVLSFINPDLTGWTFVEKVSLDTYNSFTGGGVSSGDCGSVGGYTKTDIESMLLQDEGSKTTAYYDTKGIPTIGVGYNLTRNNNVKQELIAAGVDEANATKLSSLRIDTSKAGKQIPGYTITSDQVKKLLEKDLGTFTAIAKKVATAHGINFDSLPINVKNVLIDMSYAGEGTFDEFKNMLKFVKEGNYVKAAGQIKYSDLAETKISPYCSQTGDRCGRLFSLMGGQNLNCSQQSTIGTSLTGSSNCTSLVKSLKSTDLVSVVGKIKCSESTKNPTRCTVKKEYLDSLILLNNAYKAKFNKEIEIYSSYRTQEYQKNLCGGISGACAKGCSNHMTGMAIDFTNTTIGGCLKEGSCKTSEFLWLKENGGKFGIGFYNNLGTSDNIHWSHNGR